jgi:hypothetical protein
MDPQDPFDPAHFARPADWNFPVASAVSKQPRRHRRHKRADEYFTIADWAWFVAAARLPGKAFHVGVLLRHLANLTNSKTVRWRPSKAREFGLSRQVTYRALEAIETAGLATVERHRGRCPRVTIIDVESGEKNNAEQDEASR